MTDPLSLTASVTALIGLAGSILEGCLFVKNFAKDVKNAPREILALAGELDTLESAVRTFEHSIMDSWRNGYIKSIEDYMPALEQCLEVVMSLKQEIQPEAGVFKDGGGGRWDKLKAAWKKFNIEEYHVRLNSAVSRLQVVQNNVQW
jgi:hypothetical protein